MAVAVKELLENSIDANATGITIRFVNFGVEKIEVSDNGSGISPENFPYICRRHYTSKLESFEDLEQVSTFGFRGEALASLSNICDMIISTRHTDREIGTEFMLDQTGEIISSQKRQVARTVGTTIALRHLFKTLPVRRKQLINNSKKAFQETLHLIHQYAIGINGLKIACFRKQLAAGVEMNLFTTQGLTTQANIIEVFDYRQFSNLMAIKWDQESMDLIGSKLSSREYEILNNSNFKVEGFISKPDIGCGRSSKDYHFLYLNNRPCDMLDVSKNINRIYRLFNRGQYPFVVMKLFLNERLIDRNLTPDKRKVLLCEDHIVFKVIQIILDSMFCRQEVDVHSLSSSQIMNSFLDSSLEKSSDNTLKRQSSFNSLNSSSNSDEISNNVGFLVPSGPPPRKLIRYDSDLIVENEKTLSTESSLDQIRKETNETFRSIENTFDSQTPNPQNSTEINHNEIMNSSSFEDYAFDNQAKNIDNLSDISSIHEDTEIVPNDSFISLERKNLNSDERKDNFRSLEKNLIDSRIENFNRQNIENFKAKQMVQTSLKNHPFFGSMNLHAIRKIPKTVVFSKQTKIEDQEKSLVEEEIQQEYSNLVSVAEEFEKNIQKSSNNLTLKNLNDGEIDEMFNPNDEKDDDDVNDDDVNDDNVNDDDVNNDDVNDSQLSFVVDEPLLEERQISIIDVEIEQIDKEYLNMFQSKENDIAIQKFFGGIDPETDNDAYKELKMRFSKDDFDNLEVIGQFNLGFIIARRKNNLFIIDQHAVEERRNYETLLSDPKISMQNLVCHMQLSMSSLNEMIVMENMRTFEKLGFKFAVNKGEKPGRMLKITQIPIGKEWVGSSQDVEEIVAAIRNSPTGKILSDDISTFVLSGLRREIAYSACRMSIKFGDFLTVSQMRSILARLSSLRNPFHCAHGRPTLRHLTRIPEI